MELLKWPKASYKRYQSDLVKADDNEKHGYNFSIVSTSKVVKLESPNEPKSKK